MDYPEHVRNKRNPHDLSLAAYKGHSVLGTLIRCYFSPAHRLVIDGILNTYRVFFAKHVSD